MGEFSDKVVVVTGGGSGIGLSIVEKFNAEGARLAIFEKNHEREQKIAASYRGALSFTGDVCKMSDLDLFYRQVFERFGKIDVVVANAAIAGLRPIREVDEKFFDEMVNINYKGLYFSVQKALPFLNKGAAVILISSAIAHVGWPSDTVYSSTKAAVRHLATTLSADLIDSEIRVNAISPGFVDTPIFDNIKASTPEMIPVLKKMVPVKRFASSEEIANAALFLASPRSSYIVGTELVIDGGLSAISPPLASPEVLSAIPV